MYVINDSKELLDTAYYNCLVERYVPYNLFKGEDSLERGSIEGGTEY